MLPEHRIYTADEMRVGMSAEFERDITVEDVLTFAANSGDFNPLHVDSEYAKQSNFQGRIVHGAFQVGLASAFIGMHLPGRNVLLGTANARFPSPLYFPCRVSVQGEITAWNRETLSGSVKISVREATTRTPTAEVVMGFTFHESRRSEQASIKPKPVLPDRSDDKTVLVTGASGGIGSAIAFALTNEYSVLGVAHRQNVPESLRSLPNFRQLTVDLASPGWEEVMEEALGTANLHGIVHAAWPGAPHGGLLTVADDVIERQLVFGTSCTIRLARLLFKLVGSAGGRFVTLGSIAGSQKPVITLAAYSLGKAALDNTVKLLAPELARKSITINAVCPSFVPVGMQKQADERVRKIEAARVPMGRLCSPDDIIGAVRYLLSDDASFVSGQILGLSGGQL